MRAGFRALLDAQPDIEVVGEAADGDEAVRLAVRERPDVVLMDIRMPGIDGLAATRRIAADDRLDDVHVVILTTFDLDEYVFEALRSGASGFLVKDTEPVELIQAVRVVAARRRAAVGRASPGASSRSTPAGPRSRGPSPQLDLLTEREREVMALVGAGPHQRRDRRAALHEPGHGQDPREPGHGEARRPRPGAARGVRLRVGPRPPRLVVGRAARLSRSATSRAQADTTFCADSSSHGSSIVSVTARWPVTASANAPAVTPCSLTSNSRSPRPWAMPASMWVHGVTPGVGLVSSAVDSSRKPKMTAPVQPDIRRAISTSALDAG